MLRIFLILLILVLVPAALAVENHFVWYSIPGTAKRIAANSNELWAIGGDGRIYQCLLPCDGKGNTWTLIQNSPPNIVKLSVSDQEVWGLTPAGAIYRCQLPCIDWHRVIGLLKNIQISSRTALGTDARGHFYRAELDSEESATYYPNVRWHQISGKKLKSITFRGRSIWGLDMQNRLYRFESQFHFWIRQPGRFKTISVGPEYIYGLELGRQTLMRCLLPCMESDWEKMGEDRFEQVIASPTDPLSVYALGSNGRIYQGISAT